MYENLVETLRFCAKNGDCHDCPYEKPCAGTMGDGLYCEAADAIEELSMKLHGDEAAIVGMKREIEYMVRAGKPRWIPVTERLPSENNDYLAVFIEPWFGMTVVDIMHWSGVWTYNGKHTEAKVTHWMPLPEPPKEEV